MSRRICLPASLSCPVSLSCRSAGLCCWHLCWPSTRLSSSWSFFNAVEFSWVLEEFSSYHYFRWRFVCPWWYRTFTDVIFAHTQEQLVLVATGRNTIHGSFLNDNLFVSSPMKPPGNSTDFQNLGVIAVPTHRCVILLCLILVVCQRVESRRERLKYSIETITGQLELWSVILSHMSRYFLR